MLSQQKQHDNTMCAKHSEAGHSELLSCGSTCRFDEIVKSKVLVSPAVFEGMWV